MTNIPHPQTRLRTTSLGALLLAATGATQTPAEEPTQQAPEAEAASHRFYAFHNSMRGKAAQTPAEQADLLAELGYQGFEGHNLDELPQLVAALHERKLELSTIYFRVDIDGKAEPYDPRIARYLATFLHGTGVILTVHLHSKRYGPSDPAGDAQAVPILQELADLAHAHGAKVAVYNHVNQWAESIDDGIRLSQKVNRRNFGAAFNLCHWLRLEGDRDLQARLDAIQPYLLSVTLCGADGGPEAKGAGWDRLIQPLDQGSFDNLELLKALIARGYRGPIGLQCYNIALPARELLTRSMTAWLELQRRLRSD